jgi:hypothetical protein
VTEPRITINDPRAVNSPRKIALAARVEAMVESEGKEELAVKFKEPLHPRDLAGRFIKNPFAKKKTPTKVWDPIPKPSEETDIRKKAEVIGDAAFKNTLVGLGLGAINEVMDIPKTVPRFQIYQEDLGDPESGEHNTRGAWYLGTTKIGIDTKSASDLSLTLIHEIGHFLDSNMGDLRFNGYLRTAINNSTAIKNINSLFSPRSGSTLEQRMQASYLLSPVESFARAYSQWIATRSSNARLKQEVKERQAREGSLWEPDDFEPIAREFDKIFKPKVPVPKPKKKK